MHRSRFGGTHQIHQTDFPEELIPRYSLRCAEWPLAASLQMSDESVAHLPVDFPVSACRIAIGKVVCPAFQVPIQFAYQYRDRLETLMTIRHFVQLIPFLLDGLRRRKHIQITTVASFQIAVVTKPVPQKVQTLSLFPSGPPLASFPG